MVSVLPERPDLDQLRRQAKELHAAAAGGDPRALARIGRYSARVTLAGAQLAIARRYGFASWPRLNLEVRRKRLINAGDAAGLRRLVTEHPELAVAQVSSRHAARKSGALGYLALARFHGSMDSDSAGALAMARILIDAGADLEATGYAVPGGTALAHAVEYGARSVADLLVARGAKVRGVVEMAGAGRVDLVALESGSAAELARALRAASCCERPAAIDQLLAAGIGVDAEVDGATALHWAAWQARTSSIQHLLARGADPTRRDRQHDMTPLGWYLFRREQLVKTANPDAPTDAAGSSGYWPPASPAALGRARTSAEARLVNRTSPRAISRRASSVISTSHSCWVRPRWIGVASACSVPSRAARRKCVVFCSPTTSPRSPNHSAAPRLAAVSTRVL